MRLQVVTDLVLSDAREIRLPLLWLAIPSGRVSASLAASTGVETSDEVMKYLLAGAGSPSTPFTETRLRP